MFAKHQHLTRRLDATAPHLPRRSTLETARTAAMFSDRQAVDAVIGSGSKGTPRLHGGQ